MKILKVSSEIASPIKNGSYSRGHQFDPTKFWRDQIAVPTHAVLRYQVHDETSRPIIMKLLWVCLPSDLIFRQFGSCRDPSSDNASSNLAQTLRDNTEREFLKTRADVANKMGKTNEMLTTASRRHLSILAVGRDVERAGVNMISNGKNTNNNSLYWYFAFAMSETAILKQFSLKIEPKHKSWGLVIPIRLFPTRRALDDDEMSPHCSGFFFSSQRRLIMSHAFRIKAGRLGCLNHSKHSALPSNKSKTKL